MKKEQSVDKLSVPCLLIHICSSSNHEIFHCSKKYALAFTVYIRKGFGKYYLIPAIAYLYSYLVAPRRSAWRILGCMLYKCDVVLFALFGVSSSDPVSSARTKTFYDIFIRVASMKTFRRNWKASASMPSGTVGMDIPSLLLHLFNDGDVITHKLWTAGSPAAYPFLRGVAVFVTKLMKYICCRWSFGQRSATQQVVVVRAVSSWPQYLYTVYCVWTPSICPHHPAKNAKVVLCPDSILRTLYLLLKKTGGP